MAQAPAQSSPADQAPAVTGFHTRAMTPVRNPVYVYNMDDSFRTQHPMGTNVLERQRPVSDEATRRTAAGSLPPVSGLTPIVPMAGQTPYNVWGLRPA